MNNRTKRELESAINSGRIKMSRRRFLGMAGVVVSGGLLLPQGKALSSSFSKKESSGSSTRYKIGVCDWMILKRQDIEAFPLAKKIGANGVEVDMGGLGNRKTFDSKLNDPDIRKKFLSVASEHGLEISSIAMSGFYAQSFPDRPTYMRMVQDCIDTMSAMNVKVAFLPLGVQGNLVKYPELRPAVVKRLKKIAPRAEEAGVVIGLETALEAAEEVILLEEVGSSAVQSYFNFSNALQNGRDLNKELRTLGKEHICQIHCTDQDGMLLKNNSRINMPKVKQTLDEMDWSGWLVLERSRNAENPHDVIWNFGQNARYMKSIFQRG